MDILGGTINVTAQQDGIKSTNDTDEGKGWTRLSNGTVTVNAAMTVQSLSGRRNFRGLPDG